LILEPLQRRKLTYRKLDVGWMRGIVNEEMPGLMRLCSVALSRHDDAESAKARV
jgi:hypothetical protein